MTVRSFDFLDLPLLPRYRSSILPLNDEQFLTCGNPLGTRGLLSHLSPLHNIYTAIASQNGTALMGQVMLKEGETSARLIFLAPAESPHGLILELLDHLAARAGEWGAFHLLAEVDENSPVFQSLRQAGFAMYAWQQAWKLPTRARGAKNTWEEAMEADWLAVQSLHGQIVPSLLQPVDALPKQASGLVCRAEGNLQAFVTVSRGPAGVWIQPLIPPDSSCSSDLLASLAGLSHRSVFICMRSYQAWLETVLEDLGAQAGARQAVMVRRLAMAVKETQPLPVMEKVLAKAKPAAPVSRIDSDP